MTTVLTGTRTINTRLDTRESAERTASAEPFVLRAPTESDETLARKAQEGSLAAFGALVDRFEGRLIGFLAQRGGGRSAAEDLAQEAFVRAWQRIDTYDPERRFSTWLFTIAARIASDHYRRTRRERTVLEGAGRVEEQRRAGERETHTPGELDIWALARTVLTADQMEAMWLRYVMDMRIADIASALGRSRVGTRVLLFRARERLAEAAERGNNGSTERGPRRTEGLGPEVGS